MSNIKCFTKTRMINAKSPNRELKKYTTCIDMNTGKQLRKGEKPTKIDDKTREKKRAELKKYTIAQLKTIIKKAKVKGITGKNKMGLIDMIIDNDIKYKDEKLLIDDIAKMLPKKARADNKKSAAAQAEEALAMMKKATDKEKKSEARTQKRRQKPITNTTRSNY